MAIDFYTSGRRRSLEIAGDISLTGSLVVWEEPDSISSYNVSFLNEGQIYGTWGSGGTETPPYSTTSGGHVNVTTDFRFSTPDSGTTWYIRVGASVSFSGGSPQFLAVGPSVLLTTYPARFDWTVEGEASLLYNLEEYFAAPTGTAPTDFVYKERARPDSPGLFSVTVDDVTVSATPPAWPESYDAQIGGWQRSDSNTVVSFANTSGTDYIGVTGTSSFAAVMKRTGYADAAPPSYAWSSPALSDGLSDPRSPGSVTQNSATVIAAEGHEDPDAEIPNPTEWDTVNFAFFRTRWRPAEAIEAEPLIRNFTGDDPGAFKVELVEGTSSPVVLDTETTRTTLSASRGPYYQHRGEAGVGISPSIGTRTYDSPAGNWPTPRGFSLPVWLRCYSEAVAPVGHFSHLFTKDTFAGASGVNLVSHVGEIGATWSAVSGTSTALKLDGTGGIYGNGSGILRASGNGPGTSATVTFDLDAKTTSDTFLRVFVNEGSDNYWRINLDRGVGFFGWGLVYFVGATAYGVDTESGSGSVLEVGANNHLRVVITDTGGGVTSCDVYLTNSTVTDLLILSGSSPFPTVPGQHWASTLHIQVEIQAGNSATTGTHLRNLIASVDSSAPSYESPVSMTGYGHTFDALTLTQATPKTIETSPFDFTGGDAWTGTNCTVSEVSGNLRIVVGALGAGVVAKAERSLTRRFGYRYREVKIRSAGSASKAWSLLTGVTDPATFSLIYRLRYTGTTGAEGVFVTPLVDQARLPAALPTYPDETGDGNLGQYERLVIGNLAASTTYEIEYIRDVIAPSSPELLFHREIGYTSITRDGALVKEPTGTTIAGIVTSINQFAEQGFTATASHAPRVDKPTSGYAPESDYMDSSAPAVCILGNGLMQDGTSGADYSTGGTIPAQVLWAHITLYPWAGDVFEEGAGASRGYGENTKIAAGILLRGGAYGVVVGGGSHVAGAALASASVHLERNDTGGDAGTGSSRLSGGYSTGAPYAPPGYDYKLSLSGGEPPNYLILATGSGEHIARGRRVYRSFLWVPVSGGGISADISDAYRIVRAGITSGNVALEFATDAQGMSWMPVATSIAADAVGVFWDRSGQAGRLWLVTVEGGAVKLRYTDNEGGTFSVAETIFSDGAHPAAALSRPGAGFFYARTSGGGIVGQIRDGFGHVLKDSITVVSGSVADDDIDAVYNEASTPPAIFVLYRNTGGEVETVRSTDGGLTYS